MINLKNMGACLFILVILQAVWPETSHAAQSGNLNFAEEVSKQESVYRSKGERVPDGYVTDRSLLSYTFLLSSEFDYSLASLGPTDRWLDIGAGIGQAILDYYAPRYDSMHPGGERDEAGKRRQWQFP